MGEIKILIADDHFLIRDGIKQMVLGMGFSRTEIVEVDNGACAVDEATRADFDLILLDIRMPKVDGLKALRLIRKQNVNAPVLIVSFFDEMILFKRAMNLGANGFITKDAFVEELEEAVEALLNGDTYFEPKLYSKVASDLREAERKLGWENELTNREMEVLKLIVQEKSSKEIAAALNISSRTVEWHKENLRSKLGVRSDVGLTKIAINGGLG